MCSVYSLELSLKASRFHLTSILCQHIAMDNPLCVRVYVVVSLCICAVISLSVQVQQVYMFVAISQFMIIEHINKFPVCIDQCMGYLTCYE